MISVLDSCVCCTSQVESTMLLFCAYLTEFVSRLIMLACNWNYYLIKLFVLIARFSFPQIQLSGRGSLQNWMCCFLSELWWLTCEYNLDVALCSSDTTLDGICLNCISFGRKYKHFSLGRRSSVFPADAGTWC